MTYHKANTAIGDLARDMKADASVSRNAITFAYYERYLEDSNACYAAKDLLQRAWFLWMEYTLEGDFSDDRKLRRLFGNSIMEFTTMRILLSIYLEQKQA